MEVSILILSNFETDALLSEANLRLTSQFGGHLNVNISI